MKMQFKSLNITGFPKFKRKTVVRLFYGRPNQNGCCGAIKLHFASLQEEFEPNNIHNSGVSCRREI